MQTISKHVKYVGIDDTEIDLFEGQYLVPNGIAYNSYVLTDEKTVVFDTVDKSKTEEWLDKVEIALVGRVPDYLIISHMELDHSASLREFLNKYPSVTVVGNEKTFQIAERFFGKIIINKLVVKDGDELPLGSHNLQFIFAPMVHWPEVMFTYESTEKILFSADAFGKFGAIAKKEDWTCEARRYYFNIVGKYGATVQSVLKKIAPLDVHAVFPLHGPMLTENLGYYLGKYNLWSSYLPEDKGVTIAYSSIYGNTADTARRLKYMLDEKGVRSEIFDLARCDTAEAIESAFRYDKLVMCSVTYDGGLFPATDAFINKLAGKNYQNRFVAFIENGSWAPLAAKLMRAKFESMKNITFANTVITVKSAFTHELDNSLNALVAELVG